MGITTFTTSSLQTDTAVHVTLATLPLKCGLPHGSACGTYHMYKLMW